MESKTICVRKLVLNRTLRLNACFGWEVQEELSPLTTDEMPSVTQFDDKSLTAPQPKRAHRVWLTLTRGIELPNSLRIWEKICHICFLLANILATLLMPSALVFLGCVLLDYFLSDITEAFRSVFFIVLVSLFGLWLLSLLAEIIISCVAKRKTEGLKHD